MVLLPGNDAQLLAGWGSIIRKGKQRRQLSRASPASPPLSLANLASATKGLLECGTADSAAHILSFDRCASEMSRSRGEPKTASILKGQCGPQSYNIPFSRLCAHALFIKANNATRASPYWMPRGAVSGYIAIRIETKEREHLMIVTEAQAQCHQTLITASGTSDISFWASRHLSWMHREMAESAWEPRTPSHSVTHKLVGKRAPSDLARKEGALGFSLLERSLNNAMTKGWRRNGGEALTSGFLLLEA